MSRRISKYTVGICAAVVLITAVAYAPPHVVSPEVAQHAIQLQPAQLQTNIAHSLPRLTPSPATTNVASARFAAQSIAMASLPRPDIGEFRDDTPATIDVTPTQTLSETLPSSPTPTVAPEDEPLNIAELGGKGPAMRGQFVMQTEQLDFYLGRSSLSAAQIQELAPRIEAAFRVAENRFGEQIYHRVSLGYYYPTAVNLRGMAFTDQARAELYYRSGESLGRALAPAVHELAHHLQEQRYGHTVQRRADTILLEGGATWIAGDSWLPMCGASTWKERARQIRNTGVPLELTRAERYGANNAYEMWASFVDFLLDQYGPKTYRALYTSSRGRAHGSADYQGVTGKSLDELTQEWRVWVDQ